jgi:hypothetical protein
MIVSEMAILGGMMVAMVALLSQAPKSQTAPAPLHVSNTFEFTVRESQEQVAPLFGAHRERVWAEGWNPQFVYPQPAEDRQGSVFHARHGSHESTWITTIFEPQKGHIQHVYFIPDVTAVLIDIHLSPAPHSGTNVQVRYERTALSAELNDHIRQQGEKDAKSAEEWRAAIESYFQKEGTR